MIIKSYELNKIDLNKYKFLLLHGKNEGAKLEEVEKIKEKYKEKTFYNYEEKFILDNLENFSNELFSGSLFVKEKLILINRGSDKIIKIINELCEKKINDTIIIINANLLEKKSKLRTLFERELKFISVAFYPDTNEILSKLAYNFCKSNDISISRSDINYVVSRCNGDRINLNNELQKIALYANNKKKINFDIILKLTNLAENHDISELIDQLLAKNINKAKSILNDNIFNIEDCVTILRTLSNKSKRILSLLKKLNETNSVDQAISAYKPAIFWKDKEIIKQQMSSWTVKRIKEIIFEINNIEYRVKKYQTNSLQLVLNFLINKVLIKANN